MPPPPNPSLLLKKTKILSALSVPQTAYTDLSPKGSIDAGIRELIDEINALEGYVTTSSCAGRVSVFLEGEKRGDGVKGGGEGDGERGKTVAGVGGKGGGGRWLFVSHDAVDVEEGEGDGGWTRFLGMRDGGGVAEKIICDAADRGGGGRFVNLKFEPMILHILTSSLFHAHRILSCALQAGFRESGALNLISSGSSDVTPMVGIRSMGLAFESLVGVEADGEGVCMVPEWQLANLVRVCNERFVENGRRIERFRGLVREVGKEGDGGEWEDKGARRERKREEGLRIRRARESEKSEVVGLVEDGEVGLDIAMLEHS